MNAQVIFSKINNATVIFFESIKKFKDKHCTLLAAASSFYLILTVVPLILLLLRLLGLFMKDIFMMFDSLFTMTLKFFPDLAPQVVLKLKEVVKAALYAKNQYTFLNIGILFWSSTAFFNSLWRGLYVLTGEKKLLHWKMYFKGMFLISITAGLMGLAFLVPPITHFILNFFQQSLLIKVLMENFPLFKQIMSPILGFHLGKKFLFKSTISAFVIFFFYFAFLFRWIFSGVILRPIKWSQALFSSGVFFLGMFMAKQLFWIYIRNVREGMIRNYGDYYTLILGIVWLYFLMALFYFGLCLADSFSQNSKESR